MEERGLESRDLQPGAEFEKEHDCETGPQESVELPQVGFRRAGERGHEPLLPVRGPRHMRAGGFQSLAIF
jgi:hypothetical protein